MRTQQLISLISLATLVAATKELVVAVSGLTTVNRIGDLKFMTTVTNNGNETLKILNDPNSAMSDFPADKFSIADPSGTQPSFKGARVKYVPAIAARHQGFTTLEPQQSVTIEHDLSNAYAFSIESKKAYTFHAHNKFTLVNPDSSLSKLTATVIPHTAVISAGLPKPPSSKISRRTQFIGCTADQENIINDAVVAATNYVENGYQYSVNPPSDSTGEHYTTWFGMDKPQRHAFVDSVLNNLRNNDFTTFTFDCITCTNPTLFAYVYPDQFGTIYLCAIFWRTTLMGSNSQGGTIVHEASHFLANGGTVDHEYGEEDCMELARDKPEDAITNADNYEFFVENSPPLN